MRLRRFQFLLAVAVLAIGAVVATALQRSSAQPAQAQQGNDIVDTAIAAGSFDTLVSAVQQAGLVNTLKGDGPFTVFAPTDAAFAALPASTRQALLANEDQLRQVLTYHVVPGRLTATDVAQMQTLQTVEGSPLTVETRDGNVYINGAQVTQANIRTANGVIHVIDQVLVPPGVFIQPMGK